MAALTTLYVYNYCETCAVGLPMYDPADLKDVSIELRPVSAVPINLCQGKTTMFLHW